MPSATSSVSVRTGSILHPISFAVPLFFILVRTSPVPAKSDYGYAASEPEEFSQSSLSQYFNLANKVQMREINFAGVSGA